MGTRKEKPASGSSCLSPSLTRGVGVGMSVFVGVGVGVCVAVGVFVEVKVVVDVAVGGANRDVEQLAKQSIVKMMKENLITPFKMDAQSYPNFKNFPTEGTPSLFKTNNKQYPRGICAGVDGPCKISFSSFAIRNSSCNKR